MDSNTLVYAVAIFWRDCDPVDGIAGLKLSDVKKALASSIKEELDRAVDDQMSAEGYKDEQQVMENLESLLLHSGISEFKLSNMGLTDGEIKESESDGLVHYGM